MALVNPVAAHLALTDGTSIRNIFHVGLLKKFVGTSPADLAPLPPMHQGAALPALERAVRTRLACGIRQVLVRWAGEPPSAASWEDVETFIQHYPSFQLADEVLIEGYMSCGGKHYTRRAKRNTGGSAENDAKGTVAPTPSYIQFSLGSLTLRWFSRFVSLDRS